jgi:hypothetical protein
MFSRLLPERIANDSHQGHGLKVGLMKLEVRHRNEAQDKDRGCMWDAHGMHM